MTTDTLDKSKTACWIAGTLATLDQQTFLGSYLKRHNGPYEVSISDRLVTLENGDIVHDDTKDGFARRADAKRYINDLAVQKGYRILGDREGQIAMGLRKA